MNYRGDVRKSRQDIPPHFSTLGVTFSYVTHVLPIKNTLIYLLTFLAIDDKES